MRDTRDMSRDNARQIHDNARHRDKVSRQFKIHRDNSRQTGNDARQCAT